MSIPSAKKPRSHVLGVSDTSNCMSPPGREPMVCIWPFLTKLRAEKGNPQPWACLDLPGPHSEVSELLTVSREMGKERVLSSTKPCSTQGLIPWDDTVRGRLDLPNADLVHQLFKVSNS